MHLIYNQSLIHDPFKACTSDTVHLVMDVGGCHLGFTKIRIEGDVDLLPHDLKQSVVHSEQEFYLSSEAVLSSLYDPASYELETIEHKVKKGKFTRTGPAINVKVLDEVSVKSVIDIDLVPTLKCNGIPDQLLPWKERIQTRPWPREDIRDQLFQKSCYVVGVGYHCSPDKDLEWRLSTSAIESVLGSSLTLVQRKCYILFKMLHKAALKDPKMLATYHLKNILFECLEETEGSPSIWTETNLLPCLYLLLDKLISHLEKGRVMSYFIEGYNLIDHYPAETIQDVLEKLTAVRKNPEQHLMMFDRQFAFDFSSDNIFQEVFKPYFELCEQERVEKDYDLVAHSIVMSLIYHAHSDISRNQLPLYNRTFALLKEAWDIMNVINPEFNANQFSFMSDVTYSGIEVDQSCKFQEFLRLKCTETLEVNTNVKDIASMLGLQLPMSEEPTPLYKLLTYRMFTLECFCESKELHASGIQVINADMYSGTEPDIVAISGAIQRAMLKLLVWISKLYSPPAAKSAEELQCRKTAVSMEVMKELTRDLDTGNTDTASIASFMTELTNTFSNLQLNDTPFEDAKKLEEMVNASRNPKDRNISSAKATIYELFVQYLNGSLDINLYLLSAYNTVFLFLMFGMKKAACRMIIRLDPTCLWNFSLLNGSFFQIDLKNLNRFVTKYVFPDHLFTYLGTVSSCAVKVDFFQYFLLIECSTAYPGFFDSSEVEQALTSATKSVESSRGVSRKHCAFLLSVMYFRLKRFTEALASLESIAKDVDEESRQNIEDALQLYQCLIMSLD